MATIEQGERIQSAVDDQDRDRAIELAGPAGIEETGHRGERRDAVLEGTREGRDTLRAIGVSSSPVGRGEKEQPSDTMPQMATRGRSPDGHDTDPIGDSSHGRHVMELPRRRPHSHLVRPIRHDPAAGLGPPSS